MNSKYINVLQISTLGLPDIKSVAWPNQSALKIKDFYWKQVPCVSTTILPLLLTFCFIHFGPIFPVVASPYPVHQKCSLPVTFIGTP
jgi:hypothetical protein